MHWINPINKDKELEPEEKVLSGIKTDQAIEYFEIAAGSRKISMDRISTFANRRPVLFVLFGFFAWLALAKLLVYILASQYSGPIWEEFIVTAVALGTTCLLLLFASRLGWLQKSGISSLGSGTTWIFAFLLGVYLVISNCYSYFGDATADYRWAFDRQEVAYLFLDLPIWGFIEEAVCRGFILYGLVRAWGDTKRGLVAAVFVQAILFGSLHYLSAPPGGIPLRILSASYFGAMLGVLVLCTGSLWPAIVLHVGSNASLLIRGHSAPFVDPFHIAYFREMLFLVPVILIGIWWILGESQVSSAPILEAQGTNSVASPNEDASLIKVQNRRKHADEL